MSKSSSDNDRIYWHVADDYLILFKDKAVIGRIPREHFIYLVAELSSVLRYAPHVP